VVSERRIQVDDTTVAPSFGRLFAKDFPGIEGRAPFRAVIKILCKCPVQATQQHNAASLLYDKLKAGDNLVSAVPFPEPSSSNNGFNVTLCIFLNVNVLCFLRGQIKTFPAHALIRLYTLGPACFRAIQRIADI